MAAPKKPSFDDRVKEYVDSPLMMHRVRFGEFVAARIAGNFGDYRAEVTQSKAIEGQCTCPSELSPCKHLHALRATWETNPNSFFDLEAWITELALEPKESLVEAIRNIVIADPAMLSIFGVPGFEPIDEDDPEYYG
jgi:hypothetical protein